MTPQEIKAEQKYRYEERIGILTQGLREPTPEEIKMAMEEAEKFTG